MKQVKDWSGQEGEGGAKGQAKHSREIIQAHSEMLDLGEGNMVEKLDKELTGDVLLIGRESFDSNENGGGGNGKGIEDMNAGCQK